MKVLSQGIRTWTVARAVSLRRANPNVRCWRNSQFESRIYHSSKKNYSSKSSKDVKQVVRKGQGLGPISWTSLALAGITGAGLVYYFVTEKEKKQAAAVQRNTKAIGKPKLGGQWTLVDHTGRPVTDATLREKGEFALLYFGFTYCPDICPAELIKMKKIVEKLDHIEDVGPVVLPVFISVDPKRDGVAQVSHYIKDFHPRMVGLTGTPDQVASACRAFRVYHSVADQDEEDEDDYLVDHSIVMYLIGPDGVFLDFYTQLTEVDEAVERIRKVIKEVREETAN
mmetsp:Transcript_121/g.160  ORF Transcript_121/g.160 Transcript_121/m.160 type:complete len:283 (-) Transcript_121:471-1319(-)